MIRSMSILKERKFVAIILTVGKRIKSHLLMNKIRNVKVHNHYLKILPNLNQLIQYKEGDADVDNFTQFLRKVLRSCALSNVKPAIKFSQNDIKCETDINKVYAEQGLKQHRK